MMKFLLQFSGPPLRLFLLVTLFLSDLASGELDGQIFHNQFAVLVPKGQVVDLIKRLSFRHWHYGITQA
jgi:hypothetical protein